MRSTTRWTRRLRRIDPALPGSGPCEGLRGRCVIAALGCVQASQRILLVDESRPRRRRLAAVLAQAGYRVIESPGAAAAKVQRKMVPDALVVNVGADTGAARLLRRFLESPGRGGAGRRATAP